MLAAYTTWHRIIHIICDNVELSQFSFSFLFVVKFTSNRWTKYIRIILYVVLLMLYSPQNEHHTSERPRIIKTHSFPGEGLHCFLTGLGCFSFVCLLLFRIRALCGGLHMWDIVM